MGQPVVHFEIVGKDGGTLRRYYSELFGWKIESHMEGDPIDYGVVSRDGNVGPDGIGIGGGIGTAPDGYDGHVTFYVAVPDVEAALAKAERLGGRRLMGPDRVPNGPEIGQFADPEGHVSGVVSPAM